MEQRQVPHTWRTREDPLEEIWPQALEMLQRGSGTGGEGAFRASGAKRRGCGSRRAVADVPAAGAGLAAGGRAGQGGVFHPGSEARRGAGGGLDGHGTALGITIEGRALEHKLFHAVLPYSNWEWAVRAHSESTLSLRGGPEGDAGAAGPGAARVAHRSFLDGDPSVETGRLRSVGSTRSIWGFARITASRRARSMWAGRRRTVRARASHGHLKRRIKQHLLLRGSADFQSEEEYDGFLIEGVGGGELETCEALGRGAGGDAGDG